MFAWFKELFFGKKKDSSVNEIDRAISRFHSRDYYTRNNTPTMAVPPTPKARHLQVVEEDTTLEDIVETVILVEATSSLLDSITDCHDIEVVDTSSSSDFSDWSGDGGSFSGGGASEDF